jgi:hypothetical protein
VAVHSVPYSGVMRTATLHSPSSPCEVSNQAAELIGVHLMSESPKRPNSPSLEQQAVLNQLAEAKGRALTDAEIMLILPQLASLRGVPRRTSQKVTLQHMREHIDELCSTHDLNRFTVNRPTRAYALGQFEEIHVPPIKSAISYSTALHEIGHVLGPHQRSAKAIVRERGAWRWAKRNALKWTPAMERNMRLSLEWYEKRLAQLGDEPEN